jgi:hypothetical protein
MKKITALSLALTGLTFSTGAVYAAEQPADRSRVAFFTLGAGHLPKPDSHTLLANYLYNDWDTLTDKHGDDRPGFNKVDSKSRGMALGYLRVTDKKLFGADYAYSFVVPYFDVTIDHELNINGNGVPVQGSHKDWVGLFVSPLMLEWRGQEFNQNFRLNFGIPLVKYDEDNPANVARDYYSAEAVYHYTYNFLPTWDWSLGLSYQYNFENIHNKHPQVPGPDGKYQNGDMFTFNTAVGKNFGLVSVGAAGYWIEQLRNDTIDGAKVEGQKQRTVGVGPVVSIAIPGKKSFSMVHMKYSKGVYSEEGVTGDFFNIFLTHSF